MHNKEDERGHKVYLAHLFYVYLLHKIFILVIYNNAIYYNSWNV